MSHTLWRFLLRRFFGALVFVAVVSTSALMLARLAPGDATSALLAAGVDQATIDAERARLGLDRPVLSQLGDWLGGLARFDLGPSSLYGRPVADLVLERAEHTAVLAAVVLLVATIIGLPLGILTGARPRGVLAALVSPMAIALVACPPIVGALALLAHTWIRWFGFTSARMSADARGM